MKKFTTIRNVAKSGLLSEHKLRLMAKQGSLPGIRSGNRFLINVDLLEEVLDEMSRPQADRAGENK